MTRITSWTLALALTAATPALAATTVGVHIDIGNAPPPPVVMVREEPSVVLVPQTSVYVVADDDYGPDCFHYGVYWYQYHDGWWYRGRSWRGPFRVIETRYVPGPVIGVPARYWRHPHGGPPGHMRDRGWADERGGRGRGHGRGHGRDRD